MKFRDLKKKAREKLEIAGSLPQKAFFIYLLFGVGAVVISYVASEIDPIFGSAFSMLYNFLIVYPLAYALTGIFLKIAKKKKTKASELMKVFTDGETYKRNTKTAFLMFLYVYLWTLLFIIPGIIKTYGYVLAPYILEDNPKLSAQKTLKLSEDMMKGYKMKMFWLYLTFIPWMIFSVITFGFGMFWSIPYMQATMAEFYLEVKKDYEKKNKKAK